MGKDHQSEGSFVLDYRARTLFSNAKDFPKLSLVVLSAFLFECGFCAANFVAFAAEAAFDQLRSQGFRRLIIIEAFVGIYAIFMAICALCCLGNRRRLFFIFSITAILFMVFRWALEHITFAPEPMSAR